MGIEDFIADRGLLPVFRLVGEGVGDFKELLITTGLTRRGLRRQLSILRGRALSVVFDDHYTLTPRGRRVFEEICRLRDLVSFAHNKNLKFYQE